MALSDLEKMFLFGFLGLVFAILALGFHRSPKPSPALGRKVRAAEPSTPSPTTSESYPSNKRDY